jgi:cytochrome c oxidase subunit 1
MVYFLWSLKRGAVAGPNPWMARGLEWETPSPPPTENFAVTPIVTDATHHYAPEREVGIA